MYTSIEEFSQEWNQEAESTQRIFDALTDSSLQQMVTTNDRTLGRIAWHIVTSVPGMLIEFGIKIDPAAGSEAVPSSAKDIADHLRMVNSSAIDAVKQQWTDESLKEMRNVFGMNLPKAGLLSLLVKHIIHHRGQMTILMRQAGLQIPGVYGPSREEWSRMGMDVPEI